MGDVAEGEEAEVAEVGEGVGGEEAVEGEVLEGGWRGKRRRLCGSALDLKECSETALGGRSREAAEEEEAGWWGGGGLKGEGGEGGEGRNGFLLLLI